MLLSPSTVPAFGSQMGFFEFEGSLFAVSELKSRILTETHQKNKRIHRMGLTVNATPRTNLQSPRLGLGKLLRNDPNHKLKPALQFLEKYILVLSPSYAKEQTCLSRTINEVLMKLVVGNVWIKQESCVRHGS